MRNFLREHSWPIVVSVLLHGLLAGSMLLVTYLSSQQRLPAIQPLPIDAVVMDSRVLHAAQRVKDERAEQELAGERAAAEAKAAAAQAEADARAAAEAQAATTEQAAANQAAKQEEDQAQAQARASAAKQAEADAAKA